MRAIRASGRKRMSWKNGGGETVEIAIFPPSASVNDFDWRISMATVASDGPFSIFPGIDRTLSILQGNGMALAIKGQPPVLLETARMPFSFPADVPVEARLLDGPITDLNVMTRRGVFCHTVQRITGAFSADAEPEGIVMLLSMAASVVQSGKEELRLGPLDAVILDPAAPFEIKTAEAKDGYAIRLRRA